MRVSPALAADSQGFLSAVQVYLHFGHLYLSAFSTDILRVLAPL
jgi:hypothetical protein